MFAIIKEGKISQVVRAGVAFDIDGVQYPANWLSLSTVEDKAGIGAVDVLYEPRPDDRFYFVAEAAPVLDDGVVSMGFTVVPKDILQLKADMVRQVNTDAFRLLQMTDYMDSRPNYVAPADFLTWRESVRTVAQAAKKAIASCLSVDDLAALPWIVWPPDPDQAALTK